MPYGYQGQNLPNQVVNNTGVFSISDVATLEKQGKFGGSLELIEEYIVSAAVSEVDFINLDNYSYDRFFVTISNVQMDIDNNNIYLRLSSDNGTTFETANYQYCFSRIETAGTTADGQNTSNHSIFMGWLSGTGSKNANGYISFNGLLDSSKRTNVTFHHFSIGNDTRTAFGGGTHNTAAVNNAIRLYPSGTGNTFTEGTFKIYGVKKIT